MSNYFTLKNRSILNPPTGTDLGSGNNKFANVYIGNQLTVGTTTVDSTSIGSIKIASVVYPGDDTAADTAGGQTLTITGSGFIAGASVIIDGATVSVVTVVSSTQLTFVAPAKAVGSYSLYVINPDGATAISVVGIQFSGVPAWTTAAGSLSTLYEGSAVNTQLAATGDAPVIYSLSSGSLPGGVTLSGNGRILGTANAVASSTTYNFTVKASDYQNQDTDRSFSYTVNPDTVTFNTPAGNQTYSNSTSDAFSLTLNATSAAGQSITYTANTLPTGLSISGANLTGTLSTAGTTASLVTATAVGSGKTATRTLTWAVTSPTVAVTYLLVAGGGGGNNNNNSGGGGGGGVLTGSSTPSRGTLYTVTVGGGGGNGSNGSNSSFNSLSAGGGGAGGVTVGTGDGTGSQANSGTVAGCAGGEGLYTRGASPSARSAQTYGSYTQGGSSVYSQSNGSAGGGGGGFGGGGGSAYIVSSSYASAGDGGSGYSASAWGLGMVSGGGGASGGSTGGNAGSGGGAANYGGGGNSIVYPKSGSSAGGSGIVIIRYADSNPAASATTGSPTVTVSGGFRVYTWTSSGSITF